MSSYKLYSSTINWLDKLLNLTYSKNRYGVCGHFSIFNATHTVQYTIRILKRSPTNYGNRVWFHRVMHKIKTFCLKPNYNNSNNDVNPYFSQIMAIFLPIGHYFSETNCCVPHCLFNQLNRCTDQYLNLIRIY